MKNVKKVVSSINIPWLSQRPGLEGHGDGGARPRPLQVERLRDTKTIISNVHSGNWIHVWMFSSYLRGHLHPVHPYDVWDPYDGRAHNRVLLGRVKHSNVEVVRFGAGHKEHEALEQVIYFPQRKWQKRFFLIFHLLVDGILRHVLGECLVGLLGNSQLDLKI